MDWKTILTYLYRVDWLATYGAVVGTIALILNFKKHSRKIKVKSCVCIDAQSNIDFLENPKEPLGRSGKILGPIYKVTVINPSHNTIHILEAGVESKIKWYKKIAFKAYDSSNQFLSSELRNIEFPPGTQKDFFVYLDFANPLIIPNIKNCYVIDQLNKKRYGSHTNNIPLKVPTIHTDWIT